MSSELRFHQILSIVEKEGSVTVEQLSKRLYTSASSIRRDLIALDQRNLLRRIYGGAVSINSLEQEKPSNQRMSDQRQDKQSIARLAANLVQNSDFIFMDSSTTTLHMVPFLADKTELTVFTNGAQTAISLGELKKCRVFSTGGFLRRQALSYVGDTAREALKRFNVDKLFFSCASIDIARGIMAVNEDEANLRRYLIDRVAMRVLLVDGTKYDHISFCNIVGFDKITHLITDKEPSDAWKQLLARHGVQLLYPDSPSAP